MRFFTSDLHIGHANIIKLCDRKYTSSEEMTEDIIARFNSVVTPEDTTYFLGDFSLSKKFVAPVLARMNGTKHLICGNHDECFPRKGRVLNPAEYMRFGFASVQASATIKLGDTEFQMCHFPYLEEDSGQDVRYPEHRLVDNGMPLLCGHVHEKWSTRNKMINVGVDVRNMTPISETEVLEILNNV